ncbi:MAG: hypothetical protein HYR70_01035 [Chloroflexi bacterium]|nr:hypothetical protein [Chloroflexota bacterium]MBI3341295.1 hypothetical protein [Chloroflexota bacterium]
MSIIFTFESHLPADLLNVFRSLQTPFLIQQYLDAMPYKAVERDRSPLNVMLDNQSHCLDGGLFAALALWRLGFKPLILDLAPDPGADDDHVLALYQYDGRWGALAKSNYINLGFREAVHKNLRELVMTYFEHYASTHQSKTLRGYTRPFDVSKFPLTDWAWNEDSTTKLYKKFYSQKSIPLITKKMAARLNPITDKMYSAEILHTDLSWSFGNRDE